jgi:urease accessory protein UreF
MTLPKAAALGSLSEVVKSSRESADSHSKQLHSFQRFADMLVRLVRKQAPELLPAVRYAVAPFTAAVSHESALVAAEVRAADDLHDLSDRYEVLSRQWSEYTDISKRVKDARDKIARLRRELDEEERKGTPKQYKLKNDIMVILDLKRRAVEEGQAKLEEILSARERYYAFSARRLRHAYVNLGTRLAAESREIVASFRDMQARISELRENIDGILDGSYALPEVGPVPSIAADEEEEEAEEAPRAPPKETAEEEEEGDGVPQRRDGPAVGGREPARPPEADPAPYEPAPYAQEDESPFGPE